MNVPYSLLLAIGKLGMGWDSLSWNQIEQSIGFALRAAAVSLCIVTSCYNFNYFSEIVCLIIYKTYLYRKLPRKELFYFLVYFSSIADLVYEALFIFQGQSSRKIRSSYLFLFFSTTESSDLIYQRIKEVEGFFFAVSSIDPHNIAVNTQGECNVINPIQRSTSSLSTQKGFWQKENVVKEGWYMI